MITNVGGLGEIGMFGNMKLLLSFLLLTGCCMCYSQSWQWAKRGGSNDQLDTNSGHRQEEVYSIATDSQKNVYVLSSVGMSGLDIDGNPKTNYGDLITKTDIALASFACDGTYRWSKIIGGSGYDNINSVHVDGQDNIYLAGEFGNSTAAPHPQHIDEDVIFPSQPVSWQRLILIKYNSDGNLVWYRKPQHPDVTVTESFSQTISRGLAVDSEGNSFWLVAIPPGVYADGAFSNTLEGINWYVFKYNADGNFDNAVHLDISLGGSSILYLEFVRNPNNGNYIFAGRKTNSESATVGGQVLQHTSFMFSFTSNGGFLWLRENTSTVNGGLYLFSPALDDENNIYLGGRILGNGADSFMGFSSTSPTISAFVMKLNPSATAVLWASNNFTQPISKGAVAINGGELDFTNYCFGNNFTWGSQTLNVNNLGEGNEVLLARFDKISGECIALTKIDGNVGFNDVGTALISDASGDYILGGGFGQQLTTNSGSIYNDGPQSDFFVAKYATQPCSPLNTVENPLDQIVVYPNPASNDFFIDGVGVLNYTLIDYTGRVLLSGTTSDAQIPISISTIASGSYIVKLVDLNGNVKTVKLIKR